MAPTSFLLVRHGETLWNSELRYQGHQPVALSAKGVRQAECLRDRLASQMDGLAKETAEQMPGYSLHMADSGTDNFDRDFALSLLSSDQDAIYEIEEALKRIEKNTYGICELTGKPIPKARLEAIPWTRFTVEAQAQLEREGVLRQRLFGLLVFGKETGVFDRVGELVGHRLQRGDVLVGKRGRL